MTTKILTIGEHKSENTISTSKCPLAWTKVTQGHHLVSRIISSPIMFTYCRLQDRLPGWTDYQQTDTYCRDMDRWDGHTWTVVFNQWVPLDQMFPSGSHFVHIIIKWPIFHSILFVAGGRFNTQKFHYHYNECHHYILCPNAWKKYHSLWANVPRISWLYHFN
jgi:hypothetical protein